MKYRILKVAHNVNNNKSGKGFIRAKSEKSNYYHGDLLS